MAVEVEIDVELLKSEIKKTYAGVSEEPERDFIFPTGRPWAEDLGYPAELANVPEAAVESFAGVANPWQMGRLAPGERVLDLGSGAGTDSLIAAQMVGEQGQVTGIDMTPEMLTKARAGNPRVYQFPLWLAAAYGLRGDIVEARRALTDFLEFKPDINSIAKVQKHFPNFANPRVAFAHKALFVGLRNAGLPDE